MRARERLGWWTRAAGAVVARRASAQALPDSPSIEGPSSVHRLLIPSARLAVSRKSHARSKRRSVTAPSHSEKSQITWGSPMPPRRTLRILARIAAIASLALASGASAGDPPDFPPIASPRLFHGYLSAAGVRPPAAQTLDAWQRYMDASDRQLQECLELWIRAGEPPAGEPRTSLGRGEAAPSVALERERADREHRRLAEQLALRTQLRAQLAALVAPEDQPIIEAVGKLDELRMAREAVNGGTQGISFWQTVPDISGALPLASDAKGPARAAEVRRWYAQACTGIDARIAAYRAAREAILAEAMARAERADELGIGGSTQLKALSSFMKHQRALEEQAAARGEPPPPKEAYHQELWDKVTQPDLTLMKPGTAPWKRMIQSQLAAYRALLPDLAATQREKLLHAWVPELLGEAGELECLPRLSWSANGSVAPWVGEFVRVASLTKEQRDEVRRIGREWIRDDAKIMEDAFESAASSGSISDYQRKREQRAKQALRQFAAIPGLESLGKSPARLPGGSYLDPAPEDEAAFGRSPHAVAAAPGAAPEEQDAAMGLPVGYPARNEERYATLLRLDEGQRAILATVFADARERWRTEVQPLAAQAQPTPRSEGMVSDPQARAARQEQMAKDEAAREQAWRAAATVDAATFDALAAALGERCDRNALAMLRASRAASRRIAAPGWYDATVDIAGVLLSAPISDAGRSRAFAAAAPALEGWLSARELARAATWRGTTRRSGSPSPPEGGPRAFDQKAVDAYRTQRDAVTDVRAKEAEIAALAAAALDAPERARIELHALHSREPFYYPELTDLWSIRDATVACAPESSRAALAAAMDAIIEPMATQARQRGDALIASRGANSQPGFDTSAQIAADACGDAFDIRRALATARLELLLPEGCRPTTKDGWSAYPLHGLLGDSAPPAPPAAAP